MSVVVLLRRAYTDQHSGAGRAVSSIVTVEHVQRSARLPLVPLIQAVCPLVGEMSENFLCGQRSLTLHADLGETHQARASSSHCCVEV